jgi:hypothetical protein
LRTVAAIRPTRSGPTIASISTVLPFGDDETHDGEGTSSDGDDGLILPVRLPGPAAWAFRAGANLNLERAVGHRTWEELLRVAEISP